MTAIRETLWMFNRRTAIWWVLAFLFAYYVWPTPYKRVSNGYQVHRITGNWEPL